MNCELAAAAHFPVSSKHSPAGTKEYSCENIVTAELWCSTACLTTVRTVHDQVGQSAQHQLL